MSSYSTRDIAQMLGLSLARVRSYVQAGVLSPIRGPGGEYRFSFQDIIMLRTAEGLAADIPASKVKRALKNLRAQLPVDRPVTAVQIIADGNEIVARDKDAVWRPESGQFQFDFASPGAPDADADVAAARVALAVTPEEPRAQHRRHEPPAEAFESGAELEPVDARRAEAGYRRALEQDPTDADALVNLGCLLHEAGRVVEAEQLYRRALAVVPESVVAAFNLGVALDDLGRSDDAAAAYDRALELNPNHADAHFNRARLSEATGDRAAALRHLLQYKRLTERRG